VSGVANLFTEEFYGFVHSHLADDGLLVQWVQAYEMNDVLLARIVSALLSRFEYVDVYVSNSSDLILVASPKPLPAFDITRLGTDALRSELDRVALSEPASFTARRLGGRAVLEAYARMQGAQGHSDFYPEVALGAPRARFLNQSAVLLPRLATQGLPVLDVLDGRAPPSAAEVDESDGNSEIIKLSMVSELVAASITRPRSRGALAQASPLLGMHVGRLLASSAVPVPPEGLRTWSRHVATLARFGIGALPARDLQGVWISPSWLAPGQSPEVEMVMAAYAAAAARDPRAMQATATAVLESQADFAPEVRAQMLVLAMTGAAKVDPASVAALERRYRRTLPPDPDSEEVRRFLLAWAAPPRG
jgi:spermidine synthase